MSLPTIDASNYGWATSTEYLGYGGPDWAVALNQEHDEEPMLLVWFAIHADEMDSTDLKPFRQYSISLSRLYERRNTDVDPLLYGLLYAAVLKELFMVRNVPYWDRMLVLDHKLSRII